MKARSAALSRACQTNVNDRYKSKPLKTLPNERKPSGFTVVLPQDLTKSPVRIDPSRLYGAETSEM